MAFVSIPFWSITNLHGHQIGVHAQVDVNPTETEQRLGIRSNVWLRLVERDDARDTTELHANWVLLNDPDGNDDPATGWMWAGIFSEPTRFDFDREINIRSVREPYSENLYLVAVTRPDIVSHVAYSAVLDYDDQRGTIASPIEV